MERISPKQLEQVSAAYAEMVKLHPELSVERKRTRAVSPGPPADDKEEGLRSVVRESLPEEPEAVVARVVQELVALSEGRPAILIREDDFDLEAHETLPDVLQALLRDNRTSIRNAIRGVGRIEVSNHPRRSWIGTGFIVAAPDGRDIVVTNRHVAIEMAYRRNDGAYQFVDGLIGGTITAALDLKEEVGSVINDNSGTIPIIEVLHIEDPAGPDLGFLRLSASSNSPPVTRLEFASNVKSQSPVAAIGYPAKDTRETDLNVVLDLLGDVYNKKRLAPGVLKSVSADTVSHDCSTLGGNSGSPLIDLRSGKVVGLHYGGTFPNPINQGVSAPTVADRLDDATRPRRPQRSDEKPAPSTSHGGAIDMTTQSKSNGRSVTVEVPLRITVELGEPVGAIYGASSQPAAVSIDTAVREAARDFTGRPGVVNVRSGLNLVNGLYSKDPAIIVAVDHLSPGSEDTIGSLPVSYRSFPVQVRAASAEDLLRAAAKRRPRSRSGNQLPGAGRPVSRRRR